MPARIRLALMVFASLSILAAAGVIVFAKPSSAPGRRRRPASPGRCARRSRPRTSRCATRPGATCRCASTAGRVVVLTFMYSTCRDTCPVTATTIRGALDEVGHDVPALAVSVDPQNDTPGSAQRFLVKQRLSGGRMHFLLGSPRAAGAGLARLRHPAAGQRASSTPPTCCSIDKPGASASASRSPADRPRRAGARHQASRAAARLARPSPAARAHGAREHRARTTEASTIATGAR